MLTCEICGEELMLEEEMKTHLLLSHMENELHCPLCSLSGVSYDELSHHITSSHPEEQHKATNNQQKDTKKSDDDEEEASTSSQKVFFSCPMCELSCSDAFILQEHVELHLQDQTSAAAEELDVLNSPSVSNVSVEKKFECPLCSVICSDGFSLQEHVNLHLDQSQCAGGGSPGSDLKMAARLQREEETRREKEDFKKLQAQFGLDGKGGYRKQMERKMERAVFNGVMTPADFHRKRVEMMENLASGVDDATTRTQGVVPALYEYFQTECSRDSVHVWLSAETDHYCSSQGDDGWGCGYRNFQMILSSLHKIDSYSNSIQENTVPSIPRVQRMIEEAWKEGLDPQGSSHFNGRLQGTRSWIGATEIYALLTSMRIRSRIIDFHTPSGPGGTHPRLFDWVKQYYSQPSKNSTKKLPPRLIQTSLPPLYLQHQGHSRSIVGLEQKRNGSLCLLLLDPGVTVSDFRKLQNKETVSAAVHRMRKFPRSLKHKQYQVVAVEGLLTPEEKQISILNSRLLRAERIP